MNILFLGGLYPKQLIEEIRLKSNGGFQYAANTFQWALINGLKNNTKISLSVINFPFIGPYPFYYKDVIIKGCYVSENSNLSNFVSLGFVNVPLFKDISCYIKVSKQIKTWILSTSGKKVILIYSAHLPFLRAAINIKSIDSDVIVCVIIPDLPGIPVTLNPIKKVIKWIEKKQSYKYLREAHCYILLTEAMANVIKAKSKPHLVVEGIYDIKEEDLLTSTTKSNDKIILYTGNLDIRYGIENLLLGFSQIKDDSIRLWICGDGIGSKTVIEHLRKDDRIRFWGVIDRKEVLKLQREATILINPRPIEGDYTEFSFPSKTMEYFASGTPTILNKLPGIPDNYYKYCFTLEGNTPHDIANKIIEVCKIPDSEMKLIGDEARKFIIENKSSAKQAAKIVDFLENSNINVRK